MTSEAPTITRDGQPIAVLEHAEAMALQRVELDRAVALLGSLDADAWESATDCPGWDVQRMYLHVLGACEASASMRENVHQLRSARARQRAHGGPQEAALSAVQIAERSGLAPDALLDRLAAVAPRVIEKRSSLPGGVRRLVRFRVDGPVAETWRLGYLIDVIYLRDLWMHRIDASRAVCRDVVLTPEHDGRIVGDVVREWAGRHGQPVELELSGPAGGSFRSGSGGERIQCDAVEFCRTLAGRAPGDGLLATIVPF